jgi:hypothetical protein
MVKKVKQTKPEPAPVAMEEPEQSVTIKAKVENDKKIKKQLKLMNSLVNQHLDLKQAVKAVNALQKFATSHK